MNRCAPSLAKKCISSSLRQSLCRTRFTLNQSSPVCISSSFIINNKRRFSAETGLDEEFIDLENIKPWVKNPEIKTTKRVEDIFLDILKLDLVQVHILGELVMERMGMDLEQPLGFGGGGVAGGSASVAAKAEPVEEKTKFDIKLTGFDAKNKIKVIKEVRTICGLGLKEAKDLVEGVPKLLKKDIKKEEAEELKAMLEGLGATVEID